MPRSRRDPSGVRSADDTVLPLFGASSRPRQATTHRPRAHNTLLYADDVAALVGMTKDWVYTETRAGRIPHLTLGRYYRYRPESIEEWLLEVERRSSSA